MWLKVNFSSLQIVALCLIKTWFNLVFSALRLQSCSDLDGISCAEHNGTEPSRNWWHFRVDKYPQIYFYLHLKLHFYLHMFLFTSNEGYRDSHYGLALLGWESESVRAWGCYGIFVMFALLIDIQVRTSMEQAGIPAGRRSPWEQLVQPTREYFQFQLC